MGIARTEIADLRKNIGENIGQKKGKQQNRI